MDPCGRALNVRSRLTVVLYLLVVLDRLEGIAGLAHSLRTHGPCGGSWIISGNHVLQSKLTMMTIGDQVFTDAVVCNGNPRSALTPSNVV